MQVNLPHPIPFQAGSASPQGKRQLLLGLKCRGKATARVSLPDEGARQRAPEGGWNLDLPAQPFSSYTDFANRHNMSQTTPTKPLCVQRAKVEKMGTEGPDVLQHNLSFLKGKGEAGPPPSLRRLLPASQLRRVRVLSRIER